MLVAEVEPESKRNRLLLRHHFARFAFVRLILQKTIRFPIRPQSERRTTRSKAKTTTMKTISLNVDTTRLLHHTRNSKTIYYGSTLILLVLSSSFALSVGPHVRRPLRKSSLAALCSGIVLFVRPLLTALYSLPFLFFLFPFICFPTLNLIQQTDSQPIYGQSAQNLHPEQALNRYFASSFASFQFWTLPVICSPIEFDSARTFDRPFRFLPLSFSSFFFFFFFGSGTGTRGSFVFRLQT